MTDSDERVGDWMQVWGGEAFWPLDPRASEINFTAIGESLSKICRYGGHTRQFYSVAEHCVVLSDWILRQSDGDEDLALEALIHDAAEAYVGDMVRPLKRFMPQFVEIENGILKLIYEQVGLKWTGAVSEFVSEIDTRVLLDEREVLLHTPPRSWYLEGYEPLGVPIRRMSHHQARYEWDRRLKDLT